MNVEEKRLINKILIANRGEIALRIQRGAKELGIKTVQAYSTADVDTLPVLNADESVKIGPAPSSESYLNIPSIIAAAHTKGAQAIHPGYGFLSENAEFAQACEENDLIFIGPQAKTITSMGDKSNAKKTMKRIGVPTVPGSDGPVRNLEEAKNIARGIGYPLLIKASAGGGGKGMREVTSELQFDNRYEAAKAEAGASFSNDEVYLEKLIRRPRHIEVQILADSHGNAIHLCERDCSIQRRRQKVIEEAPSPALDEILRQNMAKMALRAVRDIGYLGAGTIEFLLDEDGSFYFMEMNTRIQVEHPVSEAITGIDIIKEQINVASGLKLSTLDKSPTRPNGHAIEFRINAEDSEAGFMPNPGKITKLILPGGMGVRVDTHLYEGYSVPPNYDSLIAKIIIWGKDRAEAIARAKRALNETRIEGIKTTIPFHLKVLDNPTFVLGNYYTDFIEREMGIQ